MESHGADPAAAGEMNPAARPPLERLGLWICEPPRDGPAQMGCDEALARLAPLPVLRLYRWARPALTFGYPQRWSAIETRLRGRPAVRRWTGGGLVEHGADLTIALAVPREAPFSRLPPMDTYREIHRAIAGALDPFVPGIRLAAADDLSTGLACFAHPAPADLLAGGRKILGGAQRRSRCGLLYQGSLQIENVPPDFAVRLATRLAAHCEEWRPPAALTRLADALAASRYATPEWTTRR
jgi:lipoate-protein ligase A